MNSRSTQYKAIITTLLLVLAAGTAVSAGPQSKFGVRTGVYADVDDVFLGVEYLTPLSREVYLNPNIEMIFLEDYNYFTFNLDAHYDFPTRGNLFVWAGGGLAIVYLDPPGRLDSDTDAGVNLLFGMGVKTANHLIPYFQVKAILADRDELVVGFGLRF